MKEYQINVIAGTKVLADMVETVKDATYDATAEIKAIPPGPLPDLTAGGVEKKMEVGSGIWTWNGIVLKNPSGTDGVPEGYEGTLWFDKVNWAIAKIQKLPVASGTNVIIEGGTEVVNQDGVYLVKKGIDDTINHVILKTPVTTIVENNSGFKNWEYESSTFSGWADDFGILKNFNKISIYHKDYTATGVKVTKLKYQIRENDRDGILLAIGEIDVNFLTGAVGFIEILLGNIIKNDNNSKIWVGYWGNGNMALPLSNRLHSPYRKIRYKTITGYSTDFSSSSLTASDMSNYPYVIFSLQEENIVARQSYSDDVLAKGIAIGDLTINENKSVAGNKIFKTVKPFTDLIHDQFKIDTSEIVGGLSILTSSSTFAAWGQNMGKKKDFDAIKFPFRPYDAANLPTYCTLTIRKGSNTGDIVLQKTINGTFSVNITVDLIFVLDSRFANAADDNLFVQYHSNGYFACIGTGSGQTSSLYYATAKNSVNLASVTTNQNMLRSEFIKGSLQGAFTESAVQQIQSIAGNTVPIIPAFLLTTIVRLMPGLGYNIYDNNLCVPDFGVNLSDYRIDYQGSVGRQTKRGFRVTATENMNSVLTVSMMKGRNVLSTKTQTIRSAAASNGTGITRNVLLIGDSTINGSKISTPLKAIFDADPMKINLIGTLGGVGVKHEGRGGWTVNDYATIGRKLYVVPTTGITIVPTIGAVYQQQSGNNFTVVEVNSGYFSLEVLTGSIDLAANGTLTKISGVGDITINYTGSTTTSANPFYNSATQKFDIAHYLTNTSQILTDNDWIFFQLGINDMFSFVDLVSAETKANIMITQMKEMIANIHSYNPNIRIGLVITFPCANQDAFGINYANGQLSEMYRTTGLLTWQKKMIAEFDNPTTIANKTYLISAHLNLDTENNFPTSALYGLEVRGIVTIPTSGALYVIDGNYYTYHSGDISSGSGTLYFTGSIDPPYKGSINKSSGTGDSTINYRSFVINSTTAVNSRNTTKYIEQNNGVHLSTAGDKQVADMYAGTIKDFA